MGTIGVEGAADGEAVGKPIRSVGSTDNVVDGAGEAAGAAAAL